MSTRCQIGFYERGETDLNNFEALIYRHSDGYPGTEDGSKYGVLAEAIPFLRQWQQKRGIPHPEYCAARLLQHLCNRYDKQVKEFDKDSKFAGVLGYGISNEFHGDIEFFYAIYPNALVVYEVPADENPATWKKIETISLP